MDFFFKNGPQERLERIVSAGFRAIWDAGCPILIVREEGVGVLGYCAVIPDMTRIAMGFLRKAIPLRMAEQLLTRRIPLRPEEILKLVANWIVFTLSSLAAPLTPGAGKILSIAVRKNFRGQGLGRELLNQAIQLLIGEGKSLVRLEVRPDNQAAIRLYESLGFRMIGRLRDLQGPWVVMKSVIV